MNDTIVENEDAGVKRLNKLPQTIAFVIGGVVLLVFVYALFQRLGSAPQVAADQEAAEPQSVQTADNTEIVTRGPSVGTIPEGTPQTSQPVPGQRVITGGAPAVSYSGGQNPQPLAGATQSEQEAMAELRTKNALELQEYYMERDMAKLRFRDSAEEQAKSSPMNVAYDSGEKAQSPAAGNSLASLGFGGGGVLPNGLPAGLDTSGSGSAKAAMDAQAAQLAALSGVGQGGESDQNRQGDKRDFAENTTTGEDYLSSGLAAPISPYEIKQGTIIPALMVSGINSDLPGYIIGQVSQNVYDSTTGTHLLLPQGTKIFGQYDSGVTYGQNRVLIVWNRLILPNGKAINIDTMVGSDAAGQSGLRDKTNRHLFSLYSQAILLSAITGATEALTQNDNASSSDLERAISREFGNGLQDTTQEVIEREVQRQPTITIRPGKKFVILVDQDIILEPYVSKAATRR